VAGSRWPAPWADKYCFTLHAGLTQTFIGEAPGGFRVDLQYTPKGPVGFDAASSLDEQVQKQLRPAVLLSGTDWISVTSNGIIAFDTRVTLSVGPPEDNPDRRCVISAQLKGRTDIQSIRQADGTPLFGAMSGEQLIQAWQAGFKEGSVLPLALSVVFDVPIRGMKLGQDEIYDNCRPLERGLFVGLGGATFHPGVNSPLDSIRLDIFRLSVPTGSLGLFDGTPAYVAREASDKERGTT